MSFHTQVVNIITLIGYQSKTTIWMSVCVCNCIVHTCTDPPTRPENVYLSEVDRNRLDFTWDPVQTTCPVVEYKVTAVNCGVCPTATHNTSITCVVDDVTRVIDNLCILSIQSVVCGVTGENRSNVTATLRGIEVVLAIKYMYGKLSLCLILIYQYQVLLNQQVYCRIMTLIQEN